MSSMESLLQAPDLSATVCGVTERLNAATAAWTSFVQLSKSLRTPLKRLRFDGKGLGSKFIPLSPIPPQNRRILSLHTQFEKYQDKRPLILIFRGRYFRFCFSKNIPPKNDKYISSKEYYFIVFCLHIKLHF